MKSGLLTDAAPIGSIGAVQIEVSYGWALLLVLLMTTLAAGWLPVAAPNQSSTVYLLVAILTTLLILLSVVAHEAGHVFAARAYGLNVRRVTLYAFGGVSNLDSDPHHLAEEIQVALAGPLVNFLLAGIFGWLQGQFLGDNSLVAALFGAVEVANVMLGLLNLLPGYPLDGGRVLRLLLARARSEQEPTTRGEDEGAQRLVHWNSTEAIERATRVTALIGQLIAYALVIWGIFAIANSDVNSWVGLWLVCIGFLVLQAAHAPVAPADAAQ